MNVRFLKMGAPLTEPSTHVDIPRGRWWAFYLRVTGTNKNGQQVAAADMGTLTIKRGKAMGKDSPASMGELQSEQLDFYHRYSNLKGGYPESTSTNNGAVAFGFYIPMGVDGLPNTLDAKDSEEVDVFLDFDATAMAVDMSAATWYLYGLEAPDTPESYELDVHTQDLQAAGAGRVPKMLAAANVAALYLEDAGAVVTDVSVEVDGEKVVDKIDDAVLAAITALINEVEASGNTLMEVNLASRGNISEALNRAIGLDINFSALGTLGVTIFSVRFSSEKTSVSVAGVQDRQKRKVAVARRG